MGWFVLPGTRAGASPRRPHGSCWRRARQPRCASHPRHPAVTNAASNAIARKIGMENLGPFDNEGFMGILRCNNWRIGLLYAAIHRPYCAGGQEYDEAIAFFCDKLHFH